MASLLNLFTTTCKLVCALIMYHLVPSIPFVRNVIFHIKYNSGI